MTADDLVAWYRQQLDADEQAARELGGEAWRAATDVGDEYNVGVVVVGEGGPPLIGPLDTVVARCGVEGMDEGDGEVRAGHISLHDPMWTLRDIEVKRRRLERHSPVVAQVYGGTSLDCSWCIEHPGPRWGGHSDRRFAPRRWPCPDLLDDVSVYSGRPGYREEWRP